MKPRALLTLFAITVLAALPAGAPWCAPPPAASEASSTVIMGTASFRERVALTRAAVFEAALEDASRADAPSEVLARVQKESPGQVPISFELRLDPRRIGAGRRYAVRASIYERGRLRFTGTQVLSGLTRGRGNSVRILMHAASRDDELRERGRVWRESGATLGELPATFAGMLPCADCVGTRYQINLLPDGAYMQRMTYLREAQDQSFYELGAWSLSSDGRTLELDGGRETSTSWAVQDATTLRRLDRDGAPLDAEHSYDLTRRARVEGLEPRVRLQGMFSYRADSPRLRDCLSGLRWPVAMSDDYRALERAYTDRRAAGSELLVSLEGRIEQRPRLEGDGSEATLVVERFLRAIPGEDCAERAAQAGLEDTRWRPVRIGDRNVSISGQQREPWIMLDSRSGRVTGSGGCNRISGGYEAKDRTLRFIRLVSTQMACPSMDTEKSFFRALEAARRYRAMGRILELLDDDQRVLARLEERNLR